MKKTLLILFFGLLCKISVAQQSNISNRINWLSFEQLSDSLATNPKKVLLFFHTEWCSYCNKMLKESFTDRKVIDKVNKEYYAVHFDAEQTDTVTFGGMTFNPAHKRKQRGQFHQLALAFMKQEKPIFPTTLFLDTDLSTIESKNTYLSIKELLQIL